MSKGSHRRPAQVPASQYEANYERIFGQTYHATFRHVVDVPQSGWQVGGHDLDWRVEEGQPWIEVLCDWEDEERSGS